MSVRTKEQKKIDDLLYIMLRLSERIVNEIAEINRGRGNSSEDIFDGLTYILEDRFKFMINEENGRR